MLMKRRRRPDAPGDQPASMLIMQTLPEVLATSARVTLPEVPEAPPPDVETSRIGGREGEGGAPEMAAVLALTDMPDVPLVLQGTEFLDVATALPLHDHAELMDVPVVPQFEVAEDTLPAAEGCRSCRSWRGPGTDRRSGPVSGAAGAGRPRPGNGPAAARPRGAHGRNGGAPVRDRGGHTAGGGAAEAAGTPGAGGPSALTEMPALPPLPQVPALPNAATALQWQEQRGVPGRATAATDRGRRHTARRRATSCAELPATGGRCAALTDVPDLPPVLQARDVLDMATALQLQENMEFLDVPVLHVFQASPEVHALLAAHVLPGNHEVPHVAERPQVVELPRATEWEGPGSRR